MAASPPFAWSIASIIFTAIWLVGTLLFLARRHIEPIRSRGWELVMVTNFISVFHFAYLSAVLDVFRDRGTYDCNVLVWEGILFLPIWSAPYLVRTFRLVFKYRLEEEKSQKEGHSTWYHDHLYLVSLRFLFLYCFILVASIFIVSLIFQLTLEQPGEFNLLVQCFNLQRIPLVISGFMATCSCVGLAIKIIGVKDTFFIKGELTLVAFFTPPFFVTFLVLEWLNLLPEFKYILLLGVLVFSFSVVIVYPLLLSFRHRQLAEKVSRAENDSLGGISSPDLFELCLSNPTLFEGFKQHCIESFCVENALFYRDALLFREMDEKHRRSEIINIRTLYLKENARLLINILGRTRAQLLEEINQGSCAPEILNIAMKEVFQQMYQDTFPKFKMSSRFQQVWKKAKMEKNASVRSGKSAKSVKHGEAREHEPTKSRRGSEDLGGSKISLSAKPSQSTEPIVDPDQGDD